MTTNEKEAGFPRLNPIWFCEGELYLGKPNKKPPIDEFFLASSVREWARALASRIYEDHHAPHGEFCRDCKDLLEVKRELSRLAE